MDNVSNLYHERILSGIGEQSKPAELDGKKGFWCQPCCVFIEARDATTAINKLREGMADGSLYVTINHNNFCDNIQRLRWRKIHLALRAKIVNTVISVANYFPGIQAAEPHVQLNVITDSHMGYSAALTEAHAVIEALRIRADLTKEQVSEILEDGR